MLNLEVLGKHIYDFLKFRNNVKFKIREKIGSRFFFKALALNKPGNNIGNSTSNLAKLKFTIVIFIHHHSRLVVDEDDLKWL